MFIIIISIFGYFMHEELRIEEWYVKAIYTLIHGL